MRICFAGIAGVVLTALMSAPAQATPSEVDVDSIVRIALNLGWE